MTDWDFGRRTQRSWRDLPLPPAWVPNASPKPFPSAPPAPDPGLWPTDPRGSARLAMVNAIDAAREVVCVASFMFSDKNILDALQRASERGIRCYLLTMSQEHLLKVLEEEDESEIEKVESHKAMLNGLAGRVLVREARHLHSKLLLVDPNQSARSQGFVSTANLTTEALTRNPELVVRVPPGAVQALFDQFRVGFWAEAEHELIEPGDLQGVSPQARWTPTVAISEDLVGTSKIDHSLKQAVIDTISAARDELWISTYGIDLDDVVKPIVAKAKAGIRTHLLTRPRRAVNMKTIMALAEAGADIRGHPFVHAKCVLARSGDRLSGLLMTANFQARGLDTGFETGVILNPETSKALERILRAWSEAFPYRFEVSGARGAVEGACILWDGTRFEDALVGGSAEQALDNVQVDDLRGLDNALPSVFPSLVKGNPTRMPHESAYSWKISPPRVPRGAAKLKSESGFAAYRSGKEIYLAIETPEELSLAALEAERIGARVVLK